MTTNLSLLEIIKQRVLSYKNKATGATKAFSALISEIGDPNLPSEAGPARKKQKLNLNTANIETLVLLLKKETPEQIPELEKFLFEQLKNVNGNKKQWSNAMSLRDIIAFVRLNCDNGIFEAKDIFNHQLPDESKLKTLIFALKQMNIFIIDFAPPNRNSQPRKISFIQDNLFDRFFFFIRSLEMLPIKEIRFHQLEFRNSPDATRFWETVQSALPRLESISLFDQSLENNPNPLNPYLQLSERIQSLQISPEGINTLVQQALGNKKQGAPLSNVTTLKINCIYTPGTETPGIPESITPQTLEALEFKFLSLARFTPAIKEHFKNLIRWFPTKKIIFTNLFFHAGNLKLFSQFISSLPPITQTLEIKSKLVYELPKKLWDVFLEELAKSNICFLKIEPHKKNEQRENQLIEILDRNYQRWLLRNTTVDGLKLLILHELTKPNQNNNLSRQASSFKKSQSLLGERDKPGTQILTVNPEGRNRLMPDNNRHALFYVPDDIIETGHPTQLTYTMLSTS